MDLRGGAGLVTGGAIRLGRAIALGLARAGADVAITYSSSADAAEETVSEIRALGRRAISLRADFSADFGPDALVARVVSEMGRLDVLVNSAAIFEPGNWDDTTEDSWDRHCDQPQGPVLSSQAFGRYVKGAAAAGGRTACPCQHRRLAGRASRNRSLAYTLAKAGLVTMTHSLALALAPEIQVNAVAPGIILPPPGAGASFVERKSAHPAQRVGSPAKSSRPSSTFSTRTCDRRYDLRDGGEHLQAEQSMTDRIHIETCCCVALWASTTRSGAIVRTS